MKVLITHKGCVDGMACAAVFLMKHPEAKVHFCDYGDPVPADALDPNNDVTIADFSFKRDVMERLAHAKVYDHHKTAQADLAGLPNVTFDMQECGASMLWSVLFPLTPMPLLLQYVKDYDLWTKFLPECDEVHCYLDLITGPMSMARAISEDPIEEITAYGRVVRQAYRVQEDKAVAAKQRLYLPCGQAVNAVNSATHQSQVGNKLAEDGVPGCVWYYDRGKYRYSLRGNGSIDVSAICKRYGGGGHNNAAGFQSDSYILTN